MIPSALVPIANHLWQSTLFAIAVGLLTLLLRKNRAHVRYCLWLAASVKFLVPFSLFMFAGSQLGRNGVAAPKHSDVSFIVKQVNEPFLAAGTQLPAPRSRAQTTNLLVPALVSLWTIGSGVLLFSWWMRWRRIRCAFREASPLPLAIGVPAWSSKSFLEPGVFGVRRPVLLLPEGLAAHLAPAEFEAILAHELSHVQRRDNLAASLHMAVEVVFWFHPLVWWIGSRLMEERERACDEEVLHKGNEPETYAEAMLKVCELYMPSPLPMVAGVTGANLKKRIEAIMNNGPTLDLNFAKRAALAITGILALAVPIVLGVMNVPALRAQAQPDLRFEVASVRRVEIEQLNGRNRVFPTTGGVGTSNPRQITYRGTWIEPLIAEAFGVRVDQITGGGSVHTERYDMVANIPEGATKEQFNIMLGNLLRDRFGLRFHMESKTQPIYALRVEKNGPRFKETARRAEAPTPPASKGPDEQGFPTVSSSFKGIVGIPKPGEIFVTGQDVPMADLARLLEEPAGRPVFDETGLTGRYDFKIHFERVRRGPATSDASDPAPTIFDAVEHQLGLKLESSRADLDQLIIDAIEREPTEN